MEQLGGLIVFALIAIVSHFLSRAQEKAKEEERRNAKPTLRRDELPEETRRQLYGDVEEVPMARPRGEAPQAAPARPAPPARRDAPPRRMPPPVVARQPSLEDVDLEGGASLEELAGAEDAPRPVPPIRREQQPRRAPQPRREPQPRPAPQPRREPQPRMAPQGRAPQTAQRPAQPHPVVAAAQQRAAAQAAPVEAQPAAARVPLGRPRTARQLFATRDDVRRGILAQEILGAPRALRDYEAMQ